MAAQLPPSILNLCQQYLGNPILQVIGISGGDINQARLLKTSEGYFFIKFNSSSIATDLLETEAKGLALIRSTRRILTPEILNQGASNEGAYILMEYIASGPSTMEFWRQFGLQLASLHRSRNKYFGLDHNNFIGTLAQSNSIHESAVSFLIHERFSPQIKSAYNNHLLGDKDLKLADQFYSRLPNLIPEEKASLIHGDLWNGNFITNNNEQPVLIDPSITYGPREMDIAMSLLFGGFDQGFYDSYQESYPLLSDWEKRMDIYQLYYLLAHLNMFGSSYARSVRNILSKYQ